MRIFSSSVSVLFLVKTLELLLSDADSWKEEQPKWPVVSFFYDSL